MDSEEVKERIYAWKLNVSRQTASGSTMLSAMTRGASKKATRSWTDMTSDPNHRSDHDKFYSDEKVRRACHEMTRRNRGGSKTLESNRCFPKAQESTD
jgi:hypothetical protein